MILEDINKKIEELYADKKAKNFFNHLVRAYIPPTKVSGVLEKPKTVELRCVITKELSISIAEILEGIETEEAKKEFKDNLKSPLQELTGDKHLAVTVTDTRTCMSQPAYQAFYEWVITKMLSGDKHINWLLKDVRKDLMHKDVKKIDNPKVKKALNKIKRSKPPKPATFTLGDLSVLQEIKNKMEK